MKEISNRFARGCAAVAVLFVMSGCAGMTTFTPYPARINPLIVDLAARKPIELKQCLQSESKSKDMILYTMERGRVAQILGDTDLSIQAFAASMEAIREKDQRAVISASQIGAQAAALALNDNAIPYEGEGYERVLLHHYQALNYLVKKDLEGAGVEIRRANFEQEEAVKRHEAELQDALEEAAEKKIDPGQQNDELMSRYAQLDDVAGRVKNSFQNAYTFFLSGLVYELTDQPNDAYIDYKKALEIFPDNTFLQRDVVRLAGKLQMTQDLEDLKGRFDVDALAVPDTGGTGELVVLFEEGFAPQKQELKIPIAVRDVGIVSMAFPFYPAAWSPPRPLGVEDAGTIVGNTEPICDIRALAVKALKEKVPAIAIRQTARAVLKGATAKKAKEKLGSFGSFSANLWNLISERADLRSWITLPENAQIMRVSLPAGRHALRLKTEGSAASADVDIEIKEGGKTILHVVNAGGQLYSSVMAFGGRRSTVTNSPL